MKESIVVFSSILGSEVSKCGFQRVPIFIENRLKVVSEIHLLAPWLPNPPQGAPGIQKGGQKLSKIDDFWVGT